MGLIYGCEIGVYLRCVRRDIAWVMSGSEARESMRMGTERDFRGGFARRAVAMRRTTVASWLEWQRRGMRRLIVVSSSSVRITFVVVSDSKAVDVKAEESVTGRRSWERGR